MTSLTACPSALLCPSEQQLEGIPLCACSEGQPRGWIPSPGGTRGPQDGHKPHSNGHTGHGASGDAGVGRGGRGAPHRSETMNQRPRLMLAGLHGAGIRLWACRQLLEGMPQRS